jgi:hypothetical protein
MPSVTKQKEGGHFRSIFFSSSLSTSIVVHVRKADSANLKMQQTLQRPFSLHIALMIWYLNFRLLQKHGQEYQLTLLISMSTAQFRMVRFLFISECRYVKRSKFFFLSQTKRRSNWRSFEPQGIATSLPTGECFDTRRVQLVREPLTE